MVKVSGHSFRYKAVVKYLEISINKKGMLIPHPESVRNILDFLNGGTGSLSLTTRRAFRVVHGSLFAVCILLSPVRLQDVTYVVRQIKI